MKAHIKYQRVTALCAIIVPLIWQFHSSKVLVSRKKRIQHKLGNSLVIVTIMIYKRKIPKKSLAKMIRLVM